MPLFPHLFVVFGLSLAAEGTFICYKGTITDHGTHLTRTKMEISEKNCIACKVDVKVDKEWVYSLKCEPTKEKKCDPKKPQCAAKDGGATCCCEKDFCNGFDKIFGDVIKLITTTSKKPTTGKSTTTTGTGTTTTTTNGTQPSEETTKATVKPTTTGSGMISYSPALLTALLALLSHDF